MELEGGNWVNLSTLKIFRLRHSFLACIWVLQNLQEFSQGINFFGLGSVWISDVQNNIRFDSSRLFDVIECRIFRQPTQAGVAFWHSNTSKRWVECRIFDNRLRRESLSDIRIRASAESNVGFSISDSNVSSFPTFE